MHRKNRAASDRAGLELRLDEVRRRIDQSYTDKLDGKISEDFWQRKTIEWQAEEQRIDKALIELHAGTDDRIRDAKRILELANKAHFLYLTRTPAEQAQFAENGAFELRN